MTEQKSKCKHCGAEFEPMEHMVIVAGHDGIKGVLHKRCYDYLKARKGEPNGTDSRKEVSVLLKDRTKDTSTGSDKESN